jgi:transcriptional antiterminator NusG
MSKNKDVKINMWYVIQVRVGTEESMKLKCQKGVSEDVLGKCFIPYSETKKKIQGSWVIEKKILFPGYLFVITDRIEDLFMQLKKVIGFSKLLGIGGDIVPLEEREILFLQRFGGVEQVVQMSEGIIENVEVRITSGPLEGMEGFIRKIDRHKRRAWLELPMFGEMQRVEVGLEIVEKR